MTRTATILALCAAAAAAGCGGNAPDQQAPSAKDTPSQAAPSAAIADPAPMAFATCRSCHSTQAGQNGIGPTLHGIVGSKAGAVAGYAFSPALKNSDITWDRQSLDTWLQAPMKMVPGTKMVLPVRDADKRKAIIDYLETLK
ncbi:c-type cytochrome [Novosphingobium gossypii]|uniref:c-type cytochrome n=1 Tax=Novosphingobium gossypii TaxID=1604774 RepID=UPI003D21D3BF